MLPETGDGQSDTDGWDPLDGLAADAVKAKAEGPSRRNHLVSGDWAAWRRFKDQATGAVKDLLSDQNPEVALSFLHLCAEAHLPLRPDHPTSEAQVARDARYRFLRCLEYYFQIRHGEDASNPLALPLSSLLASLASLLALIFIRIL